MLIRFKLGNIKFRIHPPPQFEFKKQLSLHERSLLQCSFHKIFNFSEEICYKNIRINLYNSRSWKSIILDRNSFHSLRYVCCLHALLKWERKLPDTSTLARTKTTSCAEVTERRSHRSIWTHFCCYIRFLTDSWATKGTLSPDRQDICLHVQ
jgi:hypothetical protein